MEKIKEFFILKFRKPLKTDNKNESLKLNRFLGEFIVIIPVALIFNYFALLALSFFCNFIANIKVIIHSHKTYDYLSLFNIKKGLDFLLSQKEIGYFLLLAILGFLGFITIKKAFKMRLNYSDKDIKKGYEATNRWTTLPELYKQYQKIDMNPSIRIKIPLSQEEKDALNSKDKRDMITVIDGRDIKKNYKKYLRKRGDEFKLEGYILSETGEPEYKVLKAINYYDGEPGSIISRYKNTIFVDDSFAHTLGVGTTSSGKTEMFVYSMIDICSRVRDIKKRSSFIITDPKLELYKSSKKTLEERDYIVRLINLQNPRKSAGINPLAVATDLYKKGDVDKAEIMARTYAYSVFNSKEDDQLEAIWKQTATQLFTALSIAQIADCIELDKEINKKRRSKFLDKQEIFKSLSIEVQKSCREKYQNIISSKKDGEDILERSDLPALPPEASFTELNENEKTINIYSVIHFFRALCDRASLSANKDREATDKKTENLLDDYFSQRASDDYARSVYEISKNTAGRTKGSIYLNMLSELDIFSLKAIANMTAESSIDIEEIGYGKKPIAVFLGVPAEDKSNHFIITTFISQTLQRLYQLAMEKNGRLDRTLQVLVDEAGNSPQIYMLHNYVTISRSIGIYIHLWLQALDQLEDVYGKHADNIMENCGNQIYIKSTGTETSEYFSKVLGATEIIKISRNGSRFSTDKNYDERAESRPLRYDYELRNMRKGECVIARTMKREDIIGKDVVPHPIFNEIQDNLFFYEKIFCFFQTIYFRFKNKAKVDKQGRKASFRQEFLYVLSLRKRYKGTSLYYKYTYMYREFPNARDINIDDICSESREHIDFQTRINNPEKTIEKLKMFYKKNEMTLGEFSKLSQLEKQLSAIFSENFLSVLDITLDTTLQEVIEKIENVDINKYKKSEKNLNVIYKDKLIKFIKRYM